MHSLRHHYFNRYRCKNRNRNRRLKAIVLTVFVNVRNFIALHPMLLCLFDQRSMLDLQIIVPFTFLRSFLVGLFSASADGIHLALEPIDIDLTILQLQSIIVNLLSLFTQLQIFEHQHIVPKFGHFFRLILALHHHLLRHKFLSIISHHLLEFKHLLKLFLLFLVFLQSDLIGNLIFFHPIHVLGQQIVRIGQFEVLNSHIFQVFPTQLQLFPCFLVFVFPFLFLLLHLTDIGLQLLILLRLPFYLFYHLLHLLALRQVHRRYQRVQPSVRL